MLVTFTYTHLMVRMAQVCRAEHHCLAQTVKQISHTGYREHIKLYLLVKTIVINAHPKFPGFFPNKQYWGAVR